MSTHQAPLEACIEGVGFWTDGLPSWQAARAYCADGSLPADAPRRPSPQLLAPNERRRAPELVAVALQVALDACQAAGREPASLPSVFASTHGDLAITDYMCTVLAQAPASISPTRFHNSVHNAAAGYWTIGNGCMQATTAISAHRASFAQGLLEALAQLAAGADAVLLVACDARSTGPLAAISPSDGLLGGAFVLGNPAQAASRSAWRLSARLVDGDAPAPRGALALRAGGNAMAPMLPLLQALAADLNNAVLLHAGHRRMLQVDLKRDTRA